MDTIQEAIEFLSLMEEPEYVSAIVALRARVAELEERIVQAKKQSPVLCVPASIANDCAHIAARGQFDAAIDVARRYAQPFYAAPVPSTDVCRVALEDACIVSWINADLTTVEGAKKAIASLCAFDVQLATDPATNGGKVLVDKSTTVPVAQAAKEDGV